ncbi:MAG: uroporphyrinogen-III synthase [Rhodobacter sp.]|nr:uroporphyrinogen-III synthase [Paracoccaceae bacterium]MCC0075484.1 uroporphyrinogen-III synthase [Rhodobacter sp.]
MPSILLLSRPRPQSERFAELARAELPPHDTLIAPLSEVVALAVDADAFAGARGLILTSANAVPMLPPMPGLPAWCVGAATARAARKAGFAARDCGGDATALIDTLQSLRPAGPLVHAHGIHLARDVVGALREAGLTARGVAVYEARLLDWPHSVIEVLASRRRIIAPLFSPRAADGFLRNLGPLRPPGLALVAISPACAERLPADLRLLTTVAVTPDAAGMLRGISEALSQPVPLA